MGKITADELANLTYENNMPIDRKWLAHIERTYTDKELFLFCRACVEVEAPSGASKQLIGRAANILKGILF